MKEQDNACSLHTDGDYGRLQSVLEILQEGMELPVTSEALNRTFSSSAGLAEISMIPQLACLST